MIRALIVSAGTNSNEYLAKHIAELGYQRPVIVASGGEARRRMTDSDFDLVIINTPLPDEFGHEVGLFAAEKTLAGVVLLAKSGTAEQLGGKVEDYGVLVLSKPFSAVQFMQAVRIAKSTARRLARVQQENARLQEKLQQLRLVDRAKCYLIEKEHMTEAEAHRYLEKQAMDTRASRGEVAKQVLGEA